MTDAIGGRSIRDCLPNQPKLKVLHQHWPLSDPIGKGSCPRTIRRQTAVTGVL